MAGILATAWGDLKWDAEHASNFDDLVPPSHQSRVEKAAWSMSTGRFGWGCAASVCHQLLKEAEARGGGQPALRSTAAAIRPPPVHSGIVASNLVDASRLGLEADVLVHAASFRFVPW